MRKLLTAAALIVTSLGFAQAQPKTEQTPKPLSVPAEYMAVFDSYRGWVPEYQTEPFGNSLMNWALHAKEVAKVTGVNAIRNWLFTRGEDRIRQLVLANKGDLKSMFGGLFNTRGMHLVFSQPYTGDTDVLYRNWYDCLSKTKRGQLDMVVGDEVLAWINWFEEHKAGVDGQCKSDLESLAGHYGVATLSTDDFTAIGFLSRRHAANKLNQKFASAEFLRKLVHDIFDED